MGRDLTLKRERVHGSRGTHCRPRGALRTAVGIALAVIPKINLAQKYACANLHIAL